MQAVVLAELVPETAVADRVAAADRAEVAGPVAAADRVEVAGLAVAVEAAEQFRRIQSTPRVSSNPEVPVKFNKSSLLSGLIFTFRQRQLPRRITLDFARWRNGAELIQSQLRAKSEVEEAARPPVTLQFAENPGCRRTLLRLRFFQVWQSRLMALRSRQLYGATNRS